MTEVYVIVIEGIFFSGGGLFTLLVSFIGLVATSRRSPCLLRFYAFCLVLAFTVLAGGVATSLKTIFTIHAGIDSSVTGSWMAMAKDYQEDDTTTATWDILHSNSGFIYVPLLRGFPCQLCHLDIYFLSTP